MKNQFESYQPSPEEVKKAEEMMTEEQKEKSKEREATIKEGIEIGKEKGRADEKKIKEKKERMYRYLMNFEHKDVRIFEKDGYSIDGKLGTIDKDKGEVKLWVGGTAHYKLFRFDDISSIERQG